MRNEICDAEKWQLEAAKVVNAELAHSLDEIHTGIAAIEQDYGKSALWNSIDDISDQLSALQDQLAQMSLAMERTAGVNGTIYWRSDRLEYCVIHCMPRAELSFEVTLAEPKFADLEEMTRDFVRLSELFHGNTKEIQLLGRAAAKS